MRDDGGAWIGCTSQLFIQRAGRQMNELIGPVGSLDPMVA